MNLHLFFSFFVSYKSLTTDQSQKIYVLWLFSSAECTSGDNFQNFLIFSSYLISVTFDGLRYYMF